MDRLIENIKLYSPLSELEIQLLQNAVDKKIYQKNETIFTEGIISDEIYFVTKGCVILFNNVAVMIKQLSFIPKDSLYVQRKAILNNIPAIENYQAVEQTEVFNFYEIKNRNLIK